MKNNKQTTGEKQGRERQTWGCIGQQVARTARVQPVWRLFDDATARHDDVQRHYEFGRQVGRGEFSVMEAIKKGTKERYVVKCYKKSDIQRDNIGLLHSDLRRWKALDHPNIVKLYDVFESEEEFFLVEELVDGKELFDKIVERGNYSEKSAANIVRQMVSALRYLHERGLAHRDLGLENILSSGAEENEVVKLIDFEFSKSFVNDKLGSSSGCGSPGNVAPEVLTSESYDESADLWSLGVVIYTLLSGYPPFYADNAPVLFKRIMDVKYDFDDDCWDDVSEQAKDLIRHLLVKNVDERYTAEQCQNHPWVIDPRRRLRCLGATVVLLGLKRYNRAVCLQCNTDKDIVRLIARMVWRTQARDVWDPQPDEQYDLEEITL